MLNQIEEVRRYFESKGDEKSELAYAPGKWTAKEVLSHIIDTDRVMTFRAMCFARGEKASLPGFDQDLYEKLMWTDLYYRQIAAFLGFVLNGYMLFRVVRQTD